MATNQQTSGASTAAANKAASPLEKARAARKAKVLSPARKAAEDAYKNAKSDQEKAAARAHVKIVRFVEITPKRVRRALKALDGVEAMFNRNAYSYDTDQANKVLNAIATKVKRIQDKIIGAKKDADEFTL